jgi:hypothetical protein
MTNLRSICRAAAVIFLCAAFRAGAQDGGVIVSGSPYSDDALEQLLRPIALYPDPLLAEVLTAATMPAQIVVADRYVNGGGDLSQIEAQQWDPSIQALAHYPTVLKWLDDNLAWTTAVGEAFLSQQQDVMASVQRLRLLAQGEGNLQSTPQENVVSDDGVVEIEPANPDLIYVPAYPWDTIYYDPGVYCTFGVGFPIGVWLRHDWDWRNHHVITWGPGHTRPGNWWTQAPRNRVAPRGVTVWHAPGRSAGTAARSVDRGWSADAFRPARVMPSSPAPMPAIRAGTGAGGSRPGTVPGFSSGFRGDAMNVPPTVSRQAPAIREQTGGGMSGGGAFGGSESSSEARQSSVRGVESRSTMTAPAPAPASRPQPSQPAQSSQSSESSHRK